jgi:hypothetical protein
MTGRLSLRRLVTTALFVAAASAALATAGPDALLPFRDAAGAASAVSVAFVVDFGGSIGTVVGCVKVPSTDNGYFALTAFTQQENEAVPTFNPSGLLCSINGDPGSGCGQAMSSGYVYWSYWHGSSGAWQYSDTGAFATVQAGDVEGWRFQNPGTGRPNDPPPRSAPDYAAICGPVTPAAATTTTAPPSGPLSPGPQPGPVPSGGGPAQSPQGPVGASTSPTARGAASTPTTSVPSIAHRGATGTTPVGATGSTAPPASTKSSAGQQQALRASPTSASRGDGGSLAPLLIGGGIVAALVAASVLRWRRRSEAP